MQTRPVLVEVYAGWCSDCHKLDAKVFSREDVRAALRRFETIRIDATHMTDELRGIMRGYAIRGFPGLVYYGSDGQLQATLTQRGVPSAEEVLARVERVR